MPNPIKKWTVMVYLAGDNNLDDAGVADLAEMKQVGSTDNLNLLAQFDRAGANVTTTRYFLRQGTTLADDAVATLGETNMGDPAVLQGFIEWGVTEYPAEHHLVVLWNHGNGWDDTDLYRVSRTAGLRVMRRNAVVQEAQGQARGKIATNHLRAVGSRFRRSLFLPTVQAGIKQRGIAYDDDAQDFLDNKEVKAVFAAIHIRLGRKIDVVGMDACLMNMAEVAYQIRGSTDFVVGSEEVEPGDGWPYHTILGGLAADPDMSPRALSASIVTQYLASYPAGANVTQSALDQAKMPGLRRAVETLGAALRAGLARPAVFQVIHTARKRVRSYDRPEYVDLADYCRQLRALAVPAALKAVCAGVIAALSPAIVRNGSKGPDVTRSHGVSIYFPTNGVSPLYPTLDFARNSQWAKFITAF